MSQKSIDISFMKGIGILMVIMVHSVIMPYGLPDAVRQIAGFGQFGCQLMFFVSGYCLCRSYENSDRMPGRFYWKRLRKIVPSWWLLLTVNCIVGVVSLKLMGKNVLNLNTELFPVITNYLFLHGLIPGPGNNLVVRGGWFIGAIVVLYLLFPLLYRGFSIMDNRHSRGGVISFELIMVLLGISLCILVSVVFGAEWQCRNNSFMYFSFVNQLACFASGIMLYFLEESHNTVSMKFPELKFIATGILIVFLYAFRPFPSIIFAILPALAGLSAMYFLEILRKHPIKSNFFTKTVAKFGDMSFSVYLVHTYVLYEGYRLVVRLVPCALEHGRLLYVVSLPVFVLAIFYLAKVFDYAVNLFIRRVKYNG